MSASADRPWPVVLLTAAGAWLAAFPLLISVGMLLGDALTHGPTPYILGALVLAAAITVLRSRDLPLFLEQLAIPALLVGGGTLAMGVLSDLPPSSGCLVLLGVVVALAAAIPQTWLRVLLGALSAALLAVVLVPDSYGSQFLMPLLWVLHGLLALWLVATHAPIRSGRMQALVSPLAQGWLLTTVAGLAWMSGASFLVAGVAGASDAGQWAGELALHGQHGWAQRSLQAVSAGLTLAAAAWGARCWPVLKAPLPAAVALTLAGLAWFMPNLGAILLALTVTALMHRWQLCSACAVAGAWVVGAFYYQLQWPLGDKALLLVACGALLGALVWVARLRATGAPLSDPAVASATAAAEPEPGQMHQGRAWAILGSAALCLLVATGAIWQKEELIAHGKPVYLPLVPQDPRSLMQGDYMRLRFASLQERNLPLLAELGGKRPFMVVTLDARSVANPVRLHQADLPLAPGEMLLELTPKDGNWVVVTDAWFFKEGDAARWQAAKFGEFRVLPDGRALLVGMATADLKPIEASTVKH